MESFKYKGIKYKTGDSLVFTINETLIFGKLYIKPKYKFSQTILNAFICHNDSRFQGTESPNLLECSYSWTFNVNTIIEDSLYDSDVMIIGHDIKSNTKESIDIDEKLINFIETQSLQIISFYFQKENFYKQYNKLEISEKSGFVKLTDTTKNRFVEIKFGRFLTKIFNILKKDYKLDIEYSNKDVENLYNSFISFQSNKIDIVELKGIELAEGYKTENYLMIKSTLGGSCMNNKKYLSLYTHNPDSVSLLVIKIYDKIIGRCLLWKTGKGILMDKRYTLFDWVDKKFDEILKERNYISYSDLYYKECEIKIPLVYSNIESYPYLDTFRYLNTNESFLTNSIGLNKKDFILLTETDGGFKNP